MSAQVHNSRGRRQSGRDIESLDKHSRVRACSRHASVPYRSLCCLAQSHHTLNVRNKDSSSHPVKEEKDKQFAQSRSSFHHRIAFGLLSALVRPWGGASSKSGSTQCTPTPLQRGAILN
jgi:hypothetical protein